MPRNIFTLCLLCCILTLSTPTLPSVIFPGQQRFYEKEAAQVEQKHYSVLILGGGMTGVIAARQLKAKGIRDFLIIEARDELGGRLMSHNMNGIMIEAGANWVHYNTDPNAVNAEGSKSPILDLALKHGLNMVPNDLQDIAFYDVHGRTSFRKELDAAAAAYSRLVLQASRLHPDQVKLSARVGFRLNGWKARDPYSQAAEYYTFDWMYSQPPENTSWLAAASSLNGNYSNSLLSVDQRGLKHIVKSEGATFLDADQVIYNSTVEDIWYDGHSTLGSTQSVRLLDGRTFTADHVLCTFSLGVLQHGDVRFHPPLPRWKQGSIRAHSMGVYTKIFLQFDYKFWDDRQMILYADPIQRGRYTVWQSLDHVGFLPGSHIFFATVTNTESRRIEALTDIEVEAEIMSTLRAMYPSIDVPAPRAIFMPRWFSDPLFRGSYSNWPVGFNVKSQDLLRKRIGRMWFAGEATSFEAFGFLDGAYCEGERAGNAIAGCISHGECDKEVEEGAS